jgi:hypothetical protein
LLDVAKKRQCQCAKQAVRSRTGSVAVGCYASSQTAPPPLLLLLLPKTIGLIDERLSVCLSGCFVLASAAQMT